MQNSIPCEAWFGKKPNLSYLRIFGSTYYVHVSKENENKLDKSFGKYIFMGYYDKSKAYQYYDPISQKLHIN